MGEGKWRRRRWVSEIVAVEQGEKEQGYALTHIFRPNPAGGPGEPYILPDHMRELERYGFDLQSYLEQRGDVDDKDGWGVRAG